MLFIPKLAWEGVEQALAIATDLFTFLTTSNRNLVSQYQEHPEFTPELFRHCGLKKRFSLCLVITHLKSI